MAKIPVCIRGMSHTNWMNFDARYTEQQDFTVARRIPLAPT
jgi:hypothetical protein